MQQQALRPSGIESGRPGRRAVDEDEVVVIVAATRGSTPREAGARMTVLHDRSEGSIGGGHLEYAAIRLAKRLPAGCTGYLRFVLGASLGQCCGGEVELAFVPAALLGQAGGTPRRLPLTHRPDAERRDWARGPAISGEPSTGADRTVSGPSRLDVERLGRAGVALVRGDPPWLVLGDDRPVPKVLLCGAGHVGIALARILAPLACRLDWVDGRDDLPVLEPAAAPPGAAPLRWRDVDPVAAVEAAVPGTHLVVMTHDHGLDYDIIARALRRDDLPFIGLIGSMTKRRRFEHRLRAEGFDEAAIAALRCPLGEIRTRDKSPQAIAILVAAQLLAVWDERHRVAAGS